MSHPLTKIGLAWCLALSVTACSTPSIVAPSTAQPNTTDVHTAQDSLDWQGVYKGVVPCADCQGIATRLQLFANETFKLSTQYLGKSDKVWVEQGSFTWIQQGRAIQLHHISPGLYQVAEQRLYHLDGSGQRIAGDLAHQYVLTKEIKMSIEDKKWQLVELFGKAVKGSAQTHYLTLNSDTHQVSAKAGCNTLFGGYEVKQPAQLQFKQLASTMMACEHMADEETLSKALGMVDNYTVSGNTLSLNKARMAPLARFTLVESK